MRQPCRFAAAIVLVAVGAFLMLTASEPPIGSDAAASISR
jgi:hypothetical protein